MTEFERYLLRGGRTLPGDQEGLTAGDRYRNLLRTVNTYNVNRYGGRALGLAGADIDQEALTGKPRPGVLSTAFKVLDAPRRGLFKFIGADPNLTGGDVFRQADADSLLGKVGRYAGAFAFDVATDPLTYFGGISTLGRRSATLTAVAPGVRKASLEAAEQGLARKGKDAGALVERLYNNNALVKQASRQTELLGTPIEGSLTPVRQIQSRIEALKATGIADDVATSTVRRELAEEELGRIVSESLLTEGRAGVLQNLARLTGDEDVAREIFERLPAEVRGGIAVRTALGRQVGVVPGTGRGTLLGQAGIQANLARFKASAIAGRGTSVLTGGLGISGRYGPAWQQVREGLLKSMSSPDFDILKNNLGRTTVTAYDALRRAQRSATTARVTGLWSVWQATGAAKASLRDWEDRGLADEFYEAFEETFNHPEAGLIGQMTPARQAGAERARELAAAMDEWKQKQIAEGIKINDRGPGYRPLVPTEEEKKRILESRPRAGGKKDVDLEYTPEVSRTKYIERFTDANEAAKIGYIIPGTDTVALSAKTINARLGRNAYVTDPVQVAQVYMERAAKNVASQRFVNEALRAGVLVADENYVREQARFERLANFMAGVSKAAPKTAARVKDARDAAEQALVKQVSKEQLAETVAQTAGRRTQVAARREAALNVERQAAQALNDAVQAVEAARPTNAQIQARLVEYGQSGAEQRAAAAAREAANAGRRLERATRNLDVANAEVDTTREMVAAFGEEAQPLADEAFETAEALVDPFILSKEARQAATDELAAARQVRAGLRETLTSEEMRQIATFETALKNLTEKRSQYDAARAARVEASAEWAKMRKNPNIASHDVIDTLARDYARKNAALKQARIDDADKDTIKTLADDAKRARKMLVDAIGFDTGKDAPLNVYRNKVLELAEKLGSTDLAAAQVISSESKLRDVLSQLDDAFQAGDVAAITRLTEALKETYFNIRDQVTFEDLTGLRNAEVSLLRRKTPGELQLTEDVRRFSPFGEWLNSEDMRNIANSVESGDISLPRRLAGLHASSGVRTVLENMYRAERTGVFRDHVNKVLDPLLLLWKTGVTVGRGPAYVITNTIGGIYMSFLGNVSVKSLAESGRTLIAFKNALNEASNELPKASAPEQYERAFQILGKKLAGVKVGDRDAVVAFREFWERGGYGATQTYDALQLLSRYGSRAPEEAILFSQTVRSRAEEAAGPVGRGFQKVVDVGLTNPYQRLMNDAAQTSELFLRFGTYVDTMKKFNDPELAYDRVNLLHFDYTDLSEAEESIRRLVPFYTWVRHNVPMQLRAVVLDPGKMKKWMYAQQEFRAMLEDDEDSWYQQMLPEYLQDVGGFASRISTSAGPLAFGSRMPYDDVERLLKVGGWIPLSGREAANMVGPLATLPVSLLTGTNLDTGAKLGGEGVEATGYQLPLSYIPGLGTTGERGERRFSERASYAISEALPQLSIIDRLLSTTPVTRPLASKQQQERALSNFLNLSGAAALTGQSVTTLTEGAITGEARRRIEKQNVIIDKAAGQLGISVEWLRQQIRAGKTDREIAVMIRQGQGRLDEFEREKLGRQQPLDRRYQTMLRAMGQGRVDLGY
jgi:hypothetical protein